MSSSSEVTPAVRRGHGVSRHAGQLGAVSFHCSVCARSQWVQSVSVYGLTSMPGGRVSDVFEGPCLICPFCGGPAYRQGDPRLKRLPSAGAGIGLSGQGLRRVPVRFKVICDAVVGTPASRIPVLNLTTGEILYFSRRSRRVAGAHEAPGPYGRELDHWLEVQPQDYERLPEMDGEERRSLARRFLSTLGDDRIRERLWRLTEGAQPYSGFRRGLSQHPWHEGRWLEYSRRYIAPVVTDWLEQAGLVVKTEGSLLH